MKISSLIWTLVFAALILRLSSVYFEVFRTNDPPTWDVDQWLQGNPRKPFATRVLVPGIVFGTSRVAPDALRERIESGALRLPISSLPSRLEYQVLGVLVIICFTGYTIVMRKLVHAVLGAGDLPGNLITALSLFLMPVTFMYHNYSYDPSTLFLSTLLWYLMFRERWTPFFLLFLVACINKETALVFVVSAALWRTYRNGTQPSLRYLAILLAAGLVIRGGISLATSQFPGNPTEFHLFDHNLRHFVYINTLDFASTILIGFLLFSFWREKPELVRIGMSHLAILAALAVFAGYLDEYRQYLDCYSIVVLSMAYSLLKLGGKAGFPAVSPNRSLASEVEVDATGSA